MLKEYKDNIVIAVSPIYYARFFNSLLNLENVIAIELQDSEEHIFERYKDELTAIIQKKSTHVNLMQVKTL